MPVFYRLITLRTAWFLNSIVNRCYCSCISFELPPRRPPFIAPRGADNGSHAATGRRTPSLDRREARGLPSTPLPARRAAGGRRR